MNNFELFMNILIICLLVPTIVYVYRLNKNLAIFRQNQNSLAKLIESLNDATFKAEKSIPKLKSVTEHSSEDLKGVVDNAKLLKDDLVFINERANNLADRLEDVIRDGRNIKEVPAKADKPSMGTPLNNNEEDRSLAEMELLKALRSIK